MYSNQDHSFIEIQTWEYIQYECKNQTMKEMCRGIYMANACTQIYEHTNKLIKYTKIKINL